MPRPPPAPTKHRSPLPGGFPFFWILQTSTWTLAIPVGTFITLHWGFTPSEAISFAVVRAATGFLMTGFIFRPLLENWITFSRYKIPLLIFLTAGAMSGSDGFLTSRLGLLSSAANTGEQVLWMSLLIRWPLYTTWGLLYWLLREWKKSRETELRLAQTEAKQIKTELDLLRAQIDPHFLLNTLNTLLGECREPEKVSAIATALSNHLTFSLQPRNGPQTLASELKTVENYLNLEKFRFEENLVFDIDIPKQYLNTEIPFGSLLLITENAVKYGRQTSPPPLKIQITATGHENFLSLTVANTGKWTVSAPHTGLGIGLQNLRHRLALIENRHADLRIESTSGWVCVTIRLTTRTSPSDNKTKSGSKPALL